MRKLSEREVLARAYSRIGTAKYEQGDFKGAIPELSKSLEMFPDYAESYYNRGMARLHCGLYKEALRDCNKAIHLDSGLVGAYGLKASIYSNTNKIKKAIKYFNLSIAQARLKGCDGTAAESYNGRGLAYRKLKDYKKAESSFDSALILDSSYCEALYNQGLNKLDLKAFDAAIGYFDAVIQINPDDFSAFRLRGNAKEHSGNMDGAIKDYSRYVKTGPCDKSILNILVKYHRALGNTEKEEYFLGKAKKCQSE
jgi:tetratricopeptide (TPR) repeat protein